MILLKQNILSSPFFVLAIVLLAVGFVSVLYNLYKPIKHSNRKWGSADEKNKQNRIAAKLNVAALLMILAAVIFFINWLGKQK